MFYKLIYCNMCKRKNKFHLLLPVGYFTNKYLFLFVIFNI